MEDFILALWAPWKWTSTVLHAGKGRRPQEVKGNKHLCGIA